MVIESIIIIMKSNTCNGLQTPLTAVQSSMFQKSNVVNSCSGNPHICGFYKASLWPKMTHRSICTESSVVIMVFHKKKMTSMVYLFEYRPDLIQILRSYHQKQMASSCCLLFTIRQNRTRGKKYTLTNLCISGNVQTKLLLLCTLLILLILAY